MLDYETINVVFEKFGYYSGRYENLRKSLGWQTNCGMIQKDNIIIKSNWGQSQYSSRTDIPGFIIKTVDEKVLAKIYKQKYKDDEGYTIEEKEILAINNDLVKFITVFEETYQKICEYDNRQEEINKALDKANLVKHFDRIYAMEHSYEEACKISEGLKANVVKYSGYKYPKSMYDLDCCEYDNHYIFKIRQTGDKEQPKFVASNGIVFVDSDEDDKVVKHKGSLKFYLSGTQEIVEFTSNISILEIRKAIIEFETWYKEFLYSFKVADKLANK